MAWVLTVAHNDYNQYGEYYVAVWKDKPTFPQIRDFFQEKNGVSYEDMDILHMFEGTRPNLYCDYWYLIEEDVLR